jgi:FkbM family methyltransferase
MFLLREGSYKTSEPYFVPMPTPAADPKAPQFLFFPEVGVAKWFCEAGIAERGLINWVVDTFIDPAKDFVDIGAHVGTYSWTCGKKAKHTYAFECGPKTFCYLAANVALQGLEERISVFPFALGDKEGTMDYIVRSPDGGGNGIKPLCDADKSCRQFPIQMKTLDSFNLNNVGFIKIDVEGFEKEVLMGALQTLKRNNYPKILFESWGDWKEREGVPARQIREDLFNYLQLVGYRITPISGSSDMYLAQI